MIDAVLYGVTLSAKMLMRLRAPPENMLNMSRMVPFCCSMSFNIAAGFTPGTGI